MKFFLVVLIISLVISHLSRRKLKAQRVSRNQAAYGRPRRKVHEQDRPFAECFDDNDEEFDRMYDEMGDDL